MARAVSEIAGYPRDRRIDFLAGSERLIGGRSESPHLIGRMVGHETPDKFSVPPASATGAHSDDCMY